MMHTILECKLLLAYNYNDTQYSLRGLLQIAKGIYINQKHLLPGSAQDTAVFVNYLSLFWIWHGRSLCACFTYSLNVQYFDINFTIDVEEKTGRRVTLQHTAGFKQTQIFFVAL